MSRFARGHRGRTVKRLEKKKKQCLRNQAFLVLSLIIVAEKRFEKYGEAWPVPCPHVGHPYP